MDDSIFETVGPDVRRSAPVQAVPHGTSFSPSFLERYEPIGFLGRGAMGEVYLMKQRALDRLVAVKVVREDALTQSESRRLQKEARVLASVTHASILGIYDVGVDGQTPYMVCEYVEGLTLQQRVSTGPRLSLTQSLRVVCQVLDGLASAHRHGIVHRDVKPANIFLTSSGRPKLGDFGLSKQHSVSSGTMSGRIMGTPPYMSPEQCRGAGTTAASDLYAVGVVLFEVASGRRPFMGPDVLDYLMQHTSALVPRIREVDASLPEELENILLRALEKDPGRRFPSAKAFRKELLKLYHSLRGKSSSPGVSPRQSESSKPTTLEAGRLLAGRYRLIRRIGEGGMGQVWSALDEVLDRTSVAVKVLPPELWRDPEAQQSLKQEARLAQRLAG